MLVMPKDRNRNSHMTTTSCIVKKQGTNHELPSGRRQETFKKLVRRGQDANFREGLGRWSMPGKKHKETI